MEKVTIASMPHFVWAWDNNISELSPHALRTWLNFNLEAQAIKAYSNKLTPKKVVILYVQIPGNTETHYRDNVAPALKANGTADVIIESYQLDQTDFRSLVLKLKSHKPDLYIINGFPHQLSALIRSMQQFKMIKNGNTFASMDILDTAETLTNAELNGIVTAAPRFLVDNSGPYLTFKAQFKKRFNQDPSYHAAFGYDQAYIIYDAARRTNSTTTWRQSFLQIELQGVTGKLIFDKSGSLQLQSIPAIFGDNKRLQVINF